MNTTHHLKIPYSPYTDTLEMNFDLVVESLRSVSSVKPCRAAVYGMGPNGIYLSHALSELDGVESVLCVDRSVNIMVNGCRAIQPTDLKDARNIDIVFVATSPHHYRMVEAFLKRNIKDTRIILLFDHFVEQKFEKGRGQPAAPESQVEAIRSAMNTRQFYSANLLIRSGLQFNPDHEGLLKLKNELSSLVEHNDFDEDELIGNVPNPNIIVLQLIDHCNLQCYMCFRQNGMYDPHPYFKKPMSRDMFQKIIEGIDFSRVASVCLGGSGEVFLHPDVLFFMDYILNRGGRVQFITNGTFLRPSLSEQLARRSGYDLQLSLDAFTKKTYESIRVGARFEDLVENFTGFCRAVKDHGNDVNLSIASVLMRRNIEELPLILNFAADLGISTVTGNHMVVTGHAVKDPEESLIFHPKLFNRIRKECLQLAAEKGLTLHLPEPFPLNQADVEKMSSTVTADYWDICHEPWTRLDMRTSAFCICCGGHPGVPYVPSFLEKPESEPFSVKRMTGHDTLMDVFNSNILKNLRKQLLTNRPPRHCRNCFQQSNNLYKFHFNSAFNKDIMPSECYTAARDAFKRKFINTAYSRAMIREGDDL